MSGFTGDIYGRKIFLQSVAPPAATSGGAYLYADIADSDKVKVVNSSGGSKDLSTINNKYDATTDPVNDVVDPSAINKRFEIGSRWVNKLTNKEWVLTSFTDGTNTAANWVETTAAGGGGGESITFNNDPTVNAATIFKTTGVLSTVTSKSISKGTYSTVNNGVNTITVDLDPTTLTSLPNVTTLGSNAGVITFDNDLNLGTHSITLTNTPTTGTDAVNKTYVDMFALGLELKNMCVAKTTALDISNHFVETTKYTGALELIGGTNVMTLTQTLISVGDGGLQGKIDGYSSFSVNDRILFGHDTPTHRYYGIYTIVNIGDGITPWKLHRSEDADSSIEVRKGIYVFVQNGTLYKNTGWALITDVTNLDTTPQSWSQMTSSVALSSNPTYGTVSGGNITVGSGDTITSIANINITAGTAGSNSVHILNTTNSTNSTNGSLIVDGGMGIAKDIFVGGNIAVKTNAIISGTNSSNIMTGSISGGTNDVSIMTGSISGGTNTFSLMNGNNTSGINSINIGSSNVTTTLGGSLKLNNITSNGTNSLLLTSGTGVVSRLAKPTSTQILQSDAAGVVSWVNPSSASTGSITFSGNTIGGAAGNIVISPTTGDVSVAGNKITNLATPTATGDAATFDYVNTKNVTFTQLGTGTAIYTGTSGATSTNPSFKSIKSNSNKIAVSSNFGNTEVLVDVVPTNFTDIGGVGGEVVLGNNLDVTGHSIKTTAGSISLNPATSINVNNKQITNLASPSNGSDAANKTYVDMLANGLGPKNACVAKTTDTDISNKFTPVTQITITLASSYDNINYDSILLTKVGNGSINAETIDGYSNFEQYDRILFAGTGSNQYYGIYVITDLGSAIAPWKMQRAADCDNNPNSGGEVVKGIYTFITNGTTYINTGWALLTNTVPFILDTTPQSWGQITSAAAGSTPSYTSVTGGNITVGSGQDIKSSTGNVNITAGTASSDSVHIFNTTNSTANNNGALIVDGGMGIAKDTFIGGNIAAKTDAITTGSNNSSIMTGLISGGTNDVSIMTGLISGGTNTFNLMNNSNTGGINSINMGSSNATTTLGGSLKLTNIASDGTNSILLTNSTGVVSKLAKPGSTQVLQSDSAGVVSWVTPASVSTGTITFTGNTIGGAIGDIVISSTGGNINVNSNKITNLSTPSDGNDATNRTYVDTKANSKDVTFNSVGAGSTIYAGTSGNVSTNPSFKSIGANSNKISITSDANNVFIDAVPTNFTDIGGAGGEVVFGNNLDVTGHSIKTTAGTISLNPATSINVNSKKITNLATPTATGDAATFDYVNTMSNSKDVTFNSIGTGTTVYAGTSGATSTNPSFKSINANSDKIAISSDVGNTEVLIDVDPTQFNNIGDLTSNFTVEGLSVSIPNTTSSTNTTTGSLHLGGGLGVAENVNIGGVLNAGITNIKGVTNINNTAADGNTIIGNSSNTVTVKGVVNINNTAADGNTTIGNSSNTITLNGTTNINSTSANDTNSVNISNVNLNDTSTLGNVNIKSNVTYDTSTGTAGNVNIFGNNTVADAVNMGSVNIMTGSYSHTGTAVYGVDIATGNFSAATIKPVINIGSASSGVLSLNGSSINANTKQIKNVDAPSDPNDAANKTYVDMVALGLGPKNACVAKTTSTDISTYFIEITKYVATQESGALTLTQTLASIGDGGLQGKIDDYTSFANGDRILFGHNTPTNPNYGIYDIIEIGDGLTNRWKLRRSADADNNPTTGEVKKGIYTFITNGLSYANSGWALLTNIEPFILDTTPQSWGQITSAAAGSDPTYNSVTGGNIKIGTGQNITSISGDIDITAGTIGTNSIHILNTTNSTANNNGALIVDGGVGISGDVFINSTKTLNVGKLNNTDATAATAIGTAPSIFSGGVSIGNKSFISAVDIAGQTDIVGISNINKTGTAKTNIGNFGSSVSILDETITTTGTSTGGLLNINTNNNSAVSKTDTGTLTLSNVNIGIPSATVPNISTAIINTGSVYINNTAINNTVGATPGTISRGDVKISTGTIDGINTGATNNTLTNGGTVYIGGAGSSVTTAYAARNSSVGTHVKILDGQIGSNSKGGTFELMNGNVTQSGIMGDINIKSGTQFGSGVSSMGSINIFNGELNTAGTYGTLNIMNGTYTSGNKGTINMGGATCGTINMGSSTTDVVNINAKTTGSSLVPTINIKGSTFIDSAYGVNIGTNQTTENILTNNVVIGRSDVGGVIIRGKLGLLNIANSSANNNKVLLLRSDGTVYTVSTPTSTQVLQSDSTGVISWVTPATASTGTVTFTGNTIGGAAGNIVISPTSGNVDVANNKITSVATPTSTTDATNKTYVDSAISTISTIAAAKSTMRFYQNDFSLTLKRHELTNQATSKTYISDGAGHFYAKIGNQLIENNEIVYDFDTSKNKTLYLAGIKTGINSSSASIAYSQDSYNWNPLTSFDLMSVVNCIAYNGNVWVAVGSGANSVMYSYDGINWTGLGVCAFGGSSTIPIVSTTTHNGVNNYSGPGTAGLKVIWNGKMFIATCYIGASPNVAASNSGGIRNVTLPAALFDFKPGQLITTTSSPIGTYYIVSVNGNNIKTSDGVFSAATVVAHNFSSVIYSYNGIDWFASLPKLSLFNFTALCSNGDITVCADSNNSLFYYSYDLIKWTSVNSDIGYFNTIWTGKYFIAYGGLSNLTPSNNNIKYSYDGKIWNVGPTIPAIDTTKKLNTYISHNGSLVSFCNNSNNSPFLSYQIDVDSSNSFTLGTSLFDTALTANFTTSKWTGDKFLFGCSSVADSNNLICHSNMKTTAFTSGIGYDKNKVKFSDIGVTTETQVNVFAINNKKRNTITFPKDRVIIGIANSGGSNKNALFYSDDKCKTNNLVSPNIVTGSINTITDIIYCAITKTWVAFSKSSVNSRLLYSLDNGINWVNGIVVDNAICLYYANNMCLAIIETNGTSSIHYSYNGIDWYITKSSIISSTSITFGGIAWNGTVFVACYDGGSINSLVYSYNGIDWIGLGNTIFDSFGYGVVYDGSKFIAIGRGTTNLVAISNDGINWFGLGNTLLGTSVNVSYCETNGEGVTLITTEDAKVWSSYDGYYWINTQSSGNKKVKWIGDRFIKSYSAIWLIYSFNGFEWNIQDNTGGIGASIITAIGWSNSNKGTVNIASKSLLLGNGISYSYDNFNYKNSTVLSSSTFVGAAYNGNIYVAVSDSNYAYSYDGETWINNTVNLIFKVRGVLYANGIFVAYGSNNGTSGHVIAYSMNGINWLNPVANTGLLFKDCYKIIYGNTTTKTIFMAVGGGQTQGMATSDDGITWTSVTSPASKINTITSAIISDDSIPYAFCCSDNTVYKYNFANNTWSSSTINTISSIKDIAYGTCRNNSRYICTTGSTSDLIINSDINSNNIRIRFVTGSNAGNIFFLSNVVSGASASFTPTAPFAVAAGDVFIVEMPKFVIVGSIDGINTDTSLTSYDGVNWISNGYYGLGTLGSPFSFQGGMVVNDGNMFIACSRNALITDVAETTNNLAYSYDGIYWFVSGFNKSRTNPINGSINGIFINSKTSNSYVSNRLGIEYGESLVVQAPEYYDKSLTSDVSISFQQL
jgi:hypothetical protein